MTTTPTSIVYRRAAVANLLPEAVTLLGPAWPADHHAQMGPAAASTNRKLDETVVRSRLVDGTLDGSPAASVFSLAHTNIVSADATKTKLSCLMNRQGPCRPRSQTYFRSGAVGRLLSSYHIDNVQL